MPKFLYVQGMPDPDREAEAETKMRQEAEMMHRRVQGRGADALQDYQNAPMVGDEDSPEQHQAMMARGRQIAGEFDGIDQIGGAALEQERRLSQPIPGAASGGDGVQQIGDYAEQLLQRARAMRQRPTGGSR